MTATDKKEDKLMNGTGVAPIKITSGDEELQIIEPKSIMKVLVIEDEEAQRNRISKSIENLGFAVDAVASPKQAAMLIEDNKYQLIVVDIRFDAPNISGDEFVKKNLDILATGKRVAFTGYIEDIPEENISLFDEIIKKGKLGTELYEFAKDAYEDRKKFIAEEIKKNLLKDKEKVSQEWLDSKDKLIETLKNTEKRDEKMVWYKGRDLSANDLIEEVKDDESEIGKSHIRMMMNWLRRKKEVNKQ